MVQPVAWPGVKTAGGALVDVGEGMAVGVSVAVGLGVAVGAGVAVALAVGVGTAVAVNDAGARMISTVAAAPVGVIRPAWRALAAAPPFG